MSYFFFFDDRRIRTQEDPTDKDPQHCVGPRVFVKDPVLRGLFKWAKYLLNKFFSLGSVKDPDAYYFIKVSTLRKISIFV